MNRSTASWNAPVMANISHEAYCYLPHWAFGKWPNEGENTGVDSTDQYPLVHWPQEGTMWYLQMMKTTFFRPVIEWTKTEEGWCLKTSAEHAVCIKQGTACSGLWFKDAKRNFVQLHHKWFSTHWERKCWLSLFTHNLGCLVIRSH